MINLHAHINQSAIKTVLALNHDLRPYFKAVYKVVDQRGLMLHLKKNPLDEQKLQHVFEEK